MAVGRVLDRWDGGALVRQQGDRWSGSALVGQRLENYQSLVVAAAPVAYYRLDVDAHDEIAGGLSGTPAGGVSFAGASLVGPGASAVFDGVDDRIVLSDQPRLNVTSAYSFEMWIRADVVTGATRSLVAGPALQYGLRVTANADLDWYVRNASTWDHAFALGLAAATEYHVVATFGAGQLQVYVNGTLASTVPVSDTAAFFTGDVHVGEAIDGAERWDGLIDELAVYDRVLSALEVLQHFQAGA